LKQPDRVSQEPPTPGCKEWLPREKSSNIGSYLLPFLPPANSALAFFRVSLYHNAKESAMIPAPMDKIFYGAGSGKSLFFFLTKKTSFVRVDNEKEEGIN